MLGLFDTSDGLGPGFSVEVEDPLGNQVEFSKER
jgi:hypothetical protein